MKTPRITLLWCHSWPSKLIMSLGEMHATIFTPSCSFLYSLCSFLLRLQKVNIRPRQFTGENVDMLWHSLHLTLKFSINFHHKCSAVHLHYRIFNISTPLLLEHSPFLTIMCQILLIVDIHRDTIRNHSLKHIEYLSNWLNSYNITEHWTKVTSSLFYAYAQRSMKLW